MIELLSSLIYQLVESSWHVSAVLIKYYLGFTAAKLYLDEKLGIENIRNTLLEQSPNLLSIIGILGGLTMLAGLSVRPSFELFSEIVALAYLGYLFWEF